VAAAVDDARGGARVERRAAPRRRSARRAAAAPPSRFERLHRRPSARADARSSSRARSTLCAAAASRWSWWTRAIRRSGAGDGVQVLHDLHGRGLSRARNVGLAHVTSEWVVYVDDDCVVAPGLGGLARRACSTHIRTSRSCRATLPEAGAPGAEDYVAGVRVFTWSATASGAAASPTPGLVAFGRVLRRAALGCRAAGGLGRAPRAGRARPARRRRHGLQLPPAALRRGGVPDAARCARFTSSGEGPRTCPRSTAATSARGPVSR